MGWSESQSAACKKHQNHKQLEGVCPFCLRERLSQLSAVTSQKEPAIVAPSGSSSLFSPPAYSSAPSSNGMSPVHRGHHRNVSEIVGSISFMLTVGNGLKKSRSIAFVRRNFVGDQFKNGKKKKGFWSKLLHRERKKEILIHSRTGSMRERLN